MKEWGESIIPLVVRNGTGGGGGGTASLKVYVPTAKLPPLLFAAVCPSVFFFFYRPIDLRVIYHQPQKSNILNAKLSI